MKVRLHRGAIPGWSAAVLVCSLSPSHAAEIHVPQDAPTIQAGIDLAGPGDVVVVACGTYSEALLLEDGVTIRSETGLPDCVTLDVAAGTTGCTAVNDQDVVIEGIRITSSASPTRGLVARVSSSIVLRQCEFTHLEMVSSASFDPGSAAILLEEQSQAEIQDCLFADNSHTGTADLGGGAMYCDESSAMIRSSSFLRNTTIRNGAAMLSRDSAVTILSSVFRENQTVDEVGAVEGGGAIFYDGFSSPLGLVDCIFELNSSQWGGAVMASLIDMQDSRVVENEATEDGGGVWMFNGTIADCWFSDNHAVRGTALHASGGSFVRDTVFARNACHGSQCNGTSYSFAGTSFLNCTFVENQVSGDPASTAEIVDLAEFGSYLILNTIIAFSDGGRPVHLGFSAAQVDVQCSDFFGNSGGDWVGDVQGQDGVAGNISADPLFCDLPAQGYGLQSISPCAPASSGGCGLIGALDVACGAVHVEASSWGSIKALYR